MDGSVLTESAAILLREYGGPEALQLEPVDVGPPAAGELLVRQTAIGVNYHDVYVRSGLYQTLALPGTPGIEAVGLVEAVGQGVAEFAVGDRIGYITSGYGGYARHRLLPAWQAAHVPTSLSDVEAAGALLKALTTCVLLRKVHLVKAGEVILVHAAAGGVGQMLCRWASALGATVIGTAGTQEKADVARSSGAAHCILYREVDFVSQVLEITGGRGVCAAYDSVGQDTFLGSLECLDFEGKLINFGQASGPVAPFAPALLAARSASVSRPIIFHYLRSAEAVKTLMDDVFEAFDAGHIHPLEAATFPLAAAADAHRLLESRASPGAVVLLP